MDMRLALRRAYLLRRSRARCLPMGDLDKGSGKKIRRPDSAWIMLHWACGYRPTYPKRRMSAHSLAAAFRAGLKCNLDA